METIPPLNNMQNLTPPTEKPVEGMVENLPEALKEPLSGGSISLRAEVKTQGIFLDKLGVVLKLPDSGGKIIELPLELNLRTAKLDLPVSGNEAVIRLQPSGNAGASFKIISVNNLPVESFVSSGKNNISVRQPAEALIITNPADLKQVALQPLDIKPLLTSLSEKSALPSDVKNQLVEMFKPAEINLELVSIEPSAGKNIPQPLQQEIQIPPAKQNTVFVVLEKIGAELQKFNGSASSAPDILKNLAEVLGKELTSLNDLPLAGKVVSEAGLNVIKTPLGNVFAEKALKLPEGTEVLLQIKDLTESSLMRDFSPRQLPLKSLGDFQDILKPLQKPENEALFQDISAKLPALNSKMLPNLVAFIKGAMTHKLADWLGPELNERLNSAGTDGQETAVRLNGVLTNAGRDGNGWRIVEVPFFDGSSIGKIKVSVKKNNEEDNQNGKKNRPPAGTRFVVDTSFSRLGEFQFDGFSVANARRFDLIIRTGRDIGDDLYADLFRIFKNTLYELEYSGSLKVNVKENFIKICEDTIQTETLSTGIYI